MDDTSRKTERIKKEPKTKRPALFDFLYIIFYLTCRSVLHLLNDTTLTSFLEFLFYFFILGNKDPYCILFVNIIIFWEKISKMNFGR